MGFSGRKSWQRACIPRQLKSPGSCHPDDAKATAESMHWCCRVPTSWPSITMQKAVDSRQQHACATCMTLHHGCTEICTLWRAASEADSCTRAASSARFRVTRHSSTSRRGLSSSPAPAIASQPHSSAANSAQCSCINQIKANITARHPLQGMCRGGNPERRL